MKLNNSSGIIEALPNITEKELFAMNQLMMDKNYRIKVLTNFLRSDRSDRVNPDFILYTLNDYLGHLQKCIASTKKMLSFNENKKFYEKLALVDIIAYKVITIIQQINIKQLGLLLLSLQKNSDEITVSNLIPFIKLLFQDLIRIYYLGAAEVAKKYRKIHNLLLKDFIRDDFQGLKDHTASAIEECYYIYDRIFIGLYPLVLRMCSPLMLTQQQLFYSNGSRVLAWLQVAPEEILIVKETEKENDNTEQEKKMPIIVQNNSEISEKQSIPTEVQEGLQILELLFPEAGWDVLDTMPDLCPYFQPILEFNDGFTQLAPNNPLQFTLILLWILEELFQGLRLIKFVSIQPGSHIDEIVEINKILEEWILYQENIFEKNFSSDLKEYTHQIYTQPEYNKTPYGRTLLSNMYTLIKSTFLPYFDIRMFGTAKIQKDDRLPPFFIRVMQLKRLLGRYYENVKMLNMTTTPDLTVSKMSIQNLWEPYKFDISNPVSKRLNAVCAKLLKPKTNILLIQYTLSILTVLDWWINNKESFAYKNTPDYLYRVIEPGSSVPAFGVKSRTDVEVLFIRHLKLKT